jgi:peptide/nickel transport system permease protein
MLDDSEERPGWFLRFAAGRLLMTIVTVFLVTLIVFVAIRTLPGDPALNILGTNSTAAQRSQLRHVMGLNRSLSAQFIIWLGQVVRGNLGYSFSQGEPVATVVWPALKNTLLLGSCASVLAVAIGVTMGNLATSGWRVVRRATDWFEAIFLSAPQYAVALLLLILFAVVFPILPSGGLHAVGQTGFRNELSHLIMPSIALALAPGAQMARSLKTSISTLQATELLPALRGRGLSPWRLTLHAHHNALPPMVTVLGIQVGSMLGGALFVESIFSIPGLGNLIVQSVTLLDFQLVQAATLIVAAIFILVLFLADLLNALLDPRLRVRSS